MHGKGSTRYAELHCLSNFTFLRGASKPEELVVRAHELGYSALAMTDECSLAGVVRAHEAAAERSFKLIIGSEFSLSDGLKFVVLAPDREAYGDLSAFISSGRRAAKKGEYRLTREDVLHHLEGSRCLVIWLPSEQPCQLQAEWLKAVFDRRLWLGVESLRNGCDERRFAALADLSSQLSVPRVAAGDVHMHRRGRRALQDTLTAIRLGRPVNEVGTKLYSNGERYLRSRAYISQIYPENLLRETVAIAERIDFQLTELRYEYPRALVPPGQTPSSHLRKLTYAGMRWRWPDGVSKKVRGLIEHELRLIAELNYEPFFLTVHDVIQFARREGILCQGRGSAANSVVCYCLGITEVDPARMATLVERFISKERNEPPDIDVDFEHQRREEVIQYIYAKYGRERAALAATVISYRPRSAIRDVGKALGFSEAQINGLAKSIQWWDGPMIENQTLVELGLAVGSPQVNRLLTLVKSIQGFPRHLSQHVGGFVIAEETVTRLVPVENATMPERTVIQWDKDDLEALGLLKVDVLGLGMLSAIRHSLELLRSHHGLDLTLATIPAEDSQVYDMISRADTMGVFQIESRAQMAMLPRLKPRNYYDLVIEVAIIRPGPIQGDMVHPYLRRRNGEEPVSYPSPEVEQVLERTLGVPIFQEQVMQLAVVAAGFTPGEADQLRRAMAAWRRRGGLGPFEDKLINGMAERGYGKDFAQQIFNQIKGFGEYGFPESHSASFALLVYASAWLKCHYPAAFCCALLNSQPMGFYAPAQLIRNAREHGVRVRPVDINASEALSTLEADMDGVMALRLGLNRVSGLSTTGIERLLQARLEGPFRCSQDLAERAQLNQKDLGALADANALSALAGHRYRARWDVAGIENQTPLFQEFRVAEGVPLLPQPTEGESIIADYRRLGFTLGRHPLALLRKRLNREHWVSASQLPHIPGGSQITTGGLVINRQRPMSASGVMFVTLEDETGYLNLVVWERVAEQQRRDLLGSTLLRVTGELQKEDGVIHIIAERLKDYSGLLGDLATKSRDFH